MLLVAFIHILAVGVKIVLVASLLLLLVVSVTLQADADP